MSVDMSSKIDELAHNIGEVINRANALMDKFEKNEGDIAGIEEKLEKAATTDKDNLFSGNNSFEKPISIPEATKENEGINLGQADGRYSKAQTQKLEWRLGQGEQFTSLKQVFEEASKYTSSYFIKIIIKDNFEINEFKNVYNGKATLEFFGEGNQNLIIKNTIGQWDTCISVAYGSRVIFYNLKIQSTKATNEGIFLAGQGRVEFNKVSFSGKYLYCIYASCFVGLSDVTMELDKGSIGISVLLNGYLDIITKFTCNNAKVAVLADLGGRAIVRGYPCNITNCITGLKVEYGGLIDLYNKSAITFTGTTTQYSQALNTQTTNGYIRG
ncbi:hypothetical protein YZ39_00590 [Campylobacter lari]|nr:hypothetical protein [Campylobacter lari]